jgi:hypothetical protein
MCLRCADWNVTDVSKTRLPTSNYEHDQDFGQCCAALRRTTVAYQHESASVDRLPYVSYKNSSSRVVEAY